MKRLFVAAAALAAWVSAGFGGICVNWTAGGRVYEYGATSSTGPGIAASTEVVWQLIDAGPDGVADAVDQQGGDDVVLAERWVPPGGGMASDGTEWDEYLVKVGGNSVYVDADRSGEGYVFQRIYQGIPGKGTLYYQSELFRYTARDYYWELEFPDMFGVAHGAVVRADRLVSGDSGPDNPVDPSWEQDMVDGETWWYRYDWANGTATVLGGPTMGAVSVPERLGGWPVTAMDGTFADCRYLTSVTIPDSIVQIDAQAFVRCTGLRNVVLPQSVCSSGLGTVFPDSYRLITNAVLGEGVTSIGADAFAGCYSLKSVTILGNVTNDCWGSGYDSPFAHCINLERVVLGGKLTGIDKFMFCGCSGLTNVMLGNSVTSIGEGAFEGCVGLTGVTLPDSVTNIGTRSFSGCEGLETVLIPAGVESIGERAFEGCNGLAEIEVATGNTCYASTRGVLFSKDGTVLICCPAGKADTYDVPDGVKEIGACAFLGCTGLTTMVIPDSVTGFGGDAFSGCSNLATLYVPACWRGGLGSLLRENGVPWGCRVAYGRPEIVGGVEWVCTVSNGEATVTGVLASGGTVVVPDVLGGCPVTAIGEQAFYNCSDLAGMVVSESVESVGTHAFAGCYGLEALYVPAWWKGSDKLADAGVPSGCRIQYGYPEVVEGVEWVYSVGNGQATVVGGPTSGSVAVPSVLGGCLVTAIGDSAFKDATGLVGVELPDEVRCFGDYAFSGCSGLRSLTVSDMVEHIGSYAFAGVAGLTNLAILDSEADVGANAFSGSGLRLLEVPSEWRGTGKLSAAGVPSGCTVAYRESALSITPATRKFGVDGGSGAIVTSGSGMWKATTGAEWITLVATRGRAGYPVVYMVGAATDVEPRTGVVSVNGQWHTVTQDGRGASISPASATFETDGGTGTVSVTAPERTVWQARANCSWLKVGTSGGTGPGTLEYTVEAFREVKTRQGTLTVAGNTFTVFQTGRRMQLESTDATRDYLTYVIPITVEALSDTVWAVKPNASWISVVDAGNGKGSDQVTIAIAENPSWKARTGTVTIGTETFTVTQEGRTALEFGIAPEATTASVNGANGVIAVLATPDLPWSAESQANWLTIYPPTASGAGNGNVVYSASPNPTLYDRTGSIVVTPGDAKVSAKTHTVRQPAATSALSRNGYEFEASGENCEVLVTVPEIVQWQIENTNWWLKVLGDTSRMGPGTVTLQAVPNETVKARGGTVTIARKTFTVVQKGRSVELGYETRLFGTDGGDDRISVRPDGNVSWTAVASDPTWITIVTGGYGTGGGEIFYVVSPYVGDGEARTGTITVGDKVVYITQRAYAVAIEPTGALLEGNNGAGEFGVSAGNGDIWRAIATEPWITIIEGYDRVTGSGIVRFTYTDNDTGKTRTGKIIVAGEVYTLEQRARKVEAFPAAAAEDEVVGALEGSADPRLAERLETVAAYDEFRNWLEEKGMDPWTVKASAHVWPSFLLGADVLFGNEPDIRFDGVAFGPGGTKSAAPSSALEIRVTVKDGETSVPVDAAKVAALFDAATNPNDWETTPRLPVTATQTGTDGDTLLFRVSPGTGTEPAIFLRLSD